LDGRPVSPPAAVVFSDEDQVWWSEGERIETLEQVDVDAAAPWESSGSHRAAASSPIRTPAPRVAKRRRLLGGACAGLLLVGALLVNAGLSGEAHQALPSTQIAGDHVADMPSGAGRAAAPAADPVPAEIAARAPAPAHHRARAKSKRKPAPTVARPGGGSKSRPARNRPQWSPPAEFWRRRRRQQQRRPAVC